MKADEVPPGCRAIQCEACGDHLAIPEEGDAAHMTALIAQAVADHRIICTRKPPEPVPVDELAHGSARQQLANLVADPSWCPVTYAHHCGHWKAGDVCCNCYEPRSDAGPR